jgi:hypothetical protein
MNQHIQPVSKSYGGFGAETVDRHTGGLPAQGCPFFDQGYEAIVTVS